MDMLVSQENPWVSSHNHVHPELCVLQVVKGAGHHVYADQPGPFNYLISQVSDMVDSGVMPVKSNSPKYKQKREVRRTASESSQDGTVKPEVIPSPL